MGDSLVIGIGKNDFESGMKFVEISKSALTRHACILGATGSGKSTTASVIALELASNGIPAVILDRTGEYSILLGDYDKTKVWEPGRSLVMAMLELEKDTPLPVQVEGWVGVVNHYTSVTYGAQVSPLQSRVLREVLTQYYTGTKSTLTVSGLIAKLEAYEQRVRQRGGWEESIEALISRLVPLTVDLVGRTFNLPYGTADVDALFRGSITVIDMSEMVEDGAKNLLSQLVLKRVYQDAKAQGITEDVRLVMVIDEAQHLAPNSDYISIPERCAIELRKYGFSLITIATRPSLISPNILANSNTIICHLLTSDRDIEAVTNYFVEGVRYSAMKHNIRTLTTGHAFVQLNFPKPIHSIQCSIGTRVHLEILGLQGEDPVVSPNRPSATLSGERPREPIPPVRK
jgi:hypothetical protein